MRVLEPAVRISLVTLAASWLWACGDGPTTPSAAPPTPTTPSAPPPTPPPQGPFTLTGVVSDQSGPLGAIGFSLAITVGARTEVKLERTDSGGRYNTEVPNGATVWAYAGRPDYFQPCAAIATVRGADTALDVALVPGNIPVTPPPAAAGRTVSGRVVEATEPETLPVAEATVVWVVFPVIGPDLVVFADTISDATGRYLLCGLPSDQSLMLVACKTGRCSYVSVPSGGDTTVEFELPRP